MYIPLIVCFHASSRELKSACQRTATNRKQHDINRLFCVRGARFHQYLTGVCVFRQGKHLCIQKLKKVC